MEPEAAGGGAAEAADPGLAGDYGGPEGVTPLEEGIPGIAQLYRDRAEAENVFDELKNQWGWAGFTTQDQGRCQILARIGALIYNWWSLFTRLAIPNRHTEATTTRPLLLHGVARQTKHGNQTTLTITSNHAHAEPVSTRSGLSKSTPTATWPHCGAVHFEPTLALAPTLHFS